MKNNEFIRMQKLAGLPVDENNIPLIESKKPKRKISLQESKLRTKVREMIIAELSEMDEFEDEDYEQMSRETEYGISPETEEEFDLEDDDLDNEFYGNHNYTNDMENTTSNDADYEAAFTAFRDGDNWENEPINEKKDEEEEEDIDIEDDLDTDTDLDMGGDDSSKDEIQSHLMSALKGAKQIGDEKLITQIGNTITYFVKTQITDSNEI